MSQQTHPINADEVVQYHESSSLPVNIQLNQLYQRESRWPIKIYGDQQTATEMNLSNASVVTASNPNNSVRVNSQVDYIDESSNPDNNMRYQQNQISSATGVPARRGASNKNRSKATLVQPISASVSINYQSLQNPSNGSNNQQQQQPTNTQTSTNHPFRQSKPLIRTDASFVNVIKAADSRNLDGQQKLQNHHFSQPNFKNPAQTHKSVSASYKHGNKVQVKNYQIKRKGNNSTTAKCGKISGTAQNPTQANNSKLATMQETPQSYHHNINKKRKLQRGTAIATQSLRDEAITNSELELKNTCTNSVSKGSSYRQHPNITRIGHTGVERESLQSMKAVNPGQINSSLLTTYNFKTMVQVKNPASSNSFFNVNTKKVTTDSNTNLENIDSKSTFSKADQQINEVPVKVYSRPATACHSRINGTKQTSPSNRTLHDDNSKETMKIVDSSQLSKMSVRKQQYKMSRSNVSGRRYNTARSQKQVKNTKLTQGKQISFKNSELKNLFNIQEGQSTIDSRQQQAQLQPNYFYQSKISTDNNFYNDSSLATITVKQQQQYQQLNQNSKFDCDRSTQPSEMLIATNNESTEKVQEAFDKHFQMNNKFKIQPTDSKQNEKNYIRKRVAQSVRTSPRKQKKSADHLWANPSLQEKQAFQQHKINQQTNLLKELGVKEKHLQSKETQENNKNLANRPQSACQTKYYASKYKPSQNLPVKQIDQNRRLKLKQKRKDKEFADQIKAHQNQWIEDQQNQQTSSPDRKKKDYIESIKENNKGDYEVQIYKERDDQYWVIGNRLLARSRLKERVYTNKNVKLIEENFDPIRIRLRVMPLSRAPLVRSKNADFYYVEAAKLSLRGDLTYAIEMLKRGLEIKPDHLLCRFNQGVLHFKFGLLQEARDDFQQVILEHPKEPWAFYNLAICLIQLGKPAEQPQLYYNAIELCLEAISLAEKQSDNQDKPLQMDANNLIAVCYYRLQEPLLAIKYFNTAKRIKVSIDMSYRPKNTSNQLQQIYSDLFIHEIEEDLFDRDVQEKIHEKGRSNSFDFTEGFKIQKQNNQHQKPKLERRLSDENIIAQYQQQQQQPMTSIRNNNNILFDSIADQVIQETTSQTSSISTSNENEEEYAMMSESRKGKIQNIKIASSNIISASSSCNTNLRQDSYKLVVNQMKALENQKKDPHRYNKGPTQTFQQQYHQQSAETKRQSTYVSDVKRLQMIKDSRKMTIQPQVHQDTQNQNLVIDMQAEIKKLKKQLINKKGKLIGSEVKKEGEDEFHKEYERLVKEQNEKIDGPNSKLRFRQLYMTDYYNKYDGKFVGCTNKEVNELQKRATLEDWVLDNQQLKTIMKEFLKKKTDYDDDKIMQLLLRNTDIKMRPIVGSKQSEFGLEQVMKEQSQLEKKMKVLKQNFAEQKRNWNIELYMNETMINQDNYYKRDDEEKKTIEVGEDGFFLQRKDIVNQKLREILNLRTAIPDDVINILKNDLEDKVRLERQVQNRSFVTNGRLNIKQMKFIKYQFTQVPPQERDCESLDKLLSKLKYLRRQDQESRHMIYEEARFVSLQAQEIIFEQGEIGEHFYIILKGRIGVKIKQLAQVDFPFLVNILNDGEQFGELSLINLQELTENTQACQEAMSQQASSRVFNSFHQQPNGVIKSIDDPSVISESVRSLNKDSRHQTAGTKSNPEFYRRKGTCQALEYTELLELSHELVHKLFAKDNFASQQSLGLHTNSVSSSTTPQISSRLSAAGATNNANYKLQAKRTAIMRSSVPKESYQLSQQAELTRKILFLQSIKLFEPYSIKLLMPLANTLNEKIYKYGEVIHRAGEIPPGLIIIKSGQCKVCSTRVSVRPIKFIEGVSDKLGNKKKIRDIDNPQLFFDYDPENTLLNCVGDKNRNYQNSRIHVNENGEQIKNEIVYKDHLFFQQLMPTNYFGGRSLLPYELYIQLRRVYFGADYLKRPPRIAPTEEEESDEKYQIKSFLDVIADSAQVETFVLTKQDIALLPDSVLKEVYEKLAQEKEPDRPTTEDKIDQQKQDLLKWEQSKVAMTEKMLHELYMERNKGQNKL